MAPCVEYFWTRVFGDPQVCFCISRCDGHALVFQHYLLALSPQLFFCECDKWEVVVLVLSKGTWSRSECVWVETCWSFILFFSTSQHFAQFRVWGNVSDALPLGKPAGVFLRETLSTATFNHGLLYRGQHYASSAALGIHHL